MTDGDADFPLFNASNRTYCSDIRYLISDIMSDTIRQVYNFYDETHNNSIINEGIPGEVKMERMFLARIEVLKKYLPDLLNGKIEKYEKYFEPLSGGYINLFNELKAFVENKSSER